MLPVIPVEFICMLPHTTQGFPILFVGETFAVYIMIRFFFNVRIKKKAKKAKYTSLYLWIQELSVCHIKFGRILNMAILIVELSREDYKIRKVFG